MEFSWLAVATQSPETGLLHSRSCVVRTSFGHIPSIEQSKRDVFFVFITVIENIFKIFYGLSEKCKGLYSVNCIFTLLNGQEARTGYFTRSLSVADLGFGLKIVFIAYLPPPLPLNMLI
jgi:hypothetical protein